ncbi:MAG: DUF488 family protein [Muribaculaceae bacterium]|nr:DUF488 family protein [Muribaculaceae bacterium]
MSTIYYTKRAYDDPEPTEADGYRVYADRLWPRGLSHATFHYDLWAKDIAPSTELREWFHADPDGRWSEFESRYEEELRENPQFEALHKELSTHPVVTLLYSSHDHDHNNVVVLKKMLEKPLS